MLSAMSTLRWLHPGSIICTVSIGVDSLVRVPPAQCMVSTHSDINILRFCLLSPVRGSNYRKIANFIARVCYS